MDSRDGNRRQTLCQGPTPDGAIRESVDLQGRRVAQGLNEQEHRVDPVRAGRTNGRWRDVGECRHKVTSREVDTRGYGTWRVGEPRTGTCASTIFCSRTRVWGGCPYPIPHSCSSRFVFSILTWDRRALSRPDGGPSSTILREGVQGVVAHDDRNTSRAVETRGQGTLLSSVTPDLLFVVLPT